MGRETIASHLLSILISSHLYPQLGYYRKSSLLQILKDTSNRAAQAVHDLTVEGGTLTNFRYQARLGVGKHTTQFTFLMLPFYTDLKVWFYFVSLLVGLIFGQLFLLIVYKCRIRFRKNRGRVAIGASITLSIVSAFVFSGGMYIIDYVWVRFVPRVSGFIHHDQLLCPRFSLQQWDFTSDINLLFVVSFFGWLALCLIFQAVQYYDQKYLLFKATLEYEEEEDDEGHLFIDDTTARRSKSMAQSKMEATEEVKSEEEPIQGERDESKEGEEAIAALESEGPVAGSIMDRWESADDTEIGSFYKTGEMNEEQM